MNDPKFTPVVALDVDGVMRLLVRPGMTLPYDTITAEVTLRRDAYPRVLHREPEWDETGENTHSHTFSAVGAAWARELISLGIEVVWATTWQDHANTYFADILGLPHLPNALADVWPGFREGSPAWKVRALRAAFPGRPLLWVDDNAPFFDFAEQRGPRERALTRLHHIRDASAGIQQNDVDSMNTWLNHTTTPEGHDELRRLRRNLLARQAKAGIR